MSRDRPSVIWILPLWWLLLWYLVRSVAIGAAVLGWLGLSAICLGYLLSERPDPEVVRFLFWGSVPGDVLIAAWALNRWVRK